LSQFYLKITDYRDSVMKQDADIVRYIPVALLALLISDLHDIRSAFLRLLMVCLVVSIIIVDVNVKLVILQKW